MNITLWIIQAFVAATFFYSGICKSIFQEKKLVTMGQTGVEGLSMLFIRFIGVTEILGSIGLILPLALSIIPDLTMISAICLGFIMPFAAIIHYKRREYKATAFNVFLLILCIVITTGCCMQKN